MDRKITGFFLSKHDTQEDILPFRSHGCSLGIIHNEVFGDAKYASDPSGVMISHCKIHREIQPSLLRFSEQKLKSAEQKLQKISLTNGVLMLIHALSIDHILHDRLADGGEMFQHVISHLLQNRASTN